jgi:hypothetical protein
VGVVEQEWEWEQQVQEVQELQVQDHILVV